MGYEIERKFLVNGDYKSHSFKNFLKGEKAFVTIKSALEENKIKRNEWEYEIPVQDAGEMLLLCEEAVIEKTRYLIKAGKHIFEVDDFEGENEGLVIAEIELESEDEPYEKPGWLGPEVTGNVRYYNSFLSIHPYSEWGE